MNYIKKFIECVYNSEMSDDGPPLWITVKYRTNEGSYDEWPPVSASSIADDGLHDPGFGSGPVSYSDIEEIVVHSVPKNRVESASYTRKYEALIKGIKGLAGSVVLPDRVVFRANQLFG